jgi:muconolactone delta-isomerase
VRSASRKRKYRGCSRLSRQHIRTRETPHIEFLTTFEVTIPEARDQEVADIQAREADRRRDLAEQGYLVRLWMLPPNPGTWRALGLWRAEGAEELQTMLKSLPMNRWMAQETTPLHPAPERPGRRRGVRGESLALAERHAPFADPCRSHLAI